MIALLEAVDMTYHNRPTIAVSPIMTIADGNNMSPSPKCYCMTWAMLL